MRDSPGSRCASTYRSVTLEGTGRDAHSARARIVDGTTLVLQEESVRETARRAGGAQDDHVQTIMRISKIDDNDEGWEA